MSNTVSLLGQSRTDMSERIPFGENQAEQTEEAKGKEKEQGSVFAGDLNLCEDPIAQKRREAQEKAMQMIQDAWESDRAVEENLQEYRDHYEEMKKLRKEAADEVDAIEQKKQEIQEAYGVEPDSQEQKDLELLCKRADYMAGDFDSALTKEEWERCAQLEKEGLSDYQQYGLELHKRAAYFKSEMAEAQKQMKGDQESIRGIQLERLKYHTMTDARKDADEVLESAGKEIIGMLVDEVKDNVDEAKEEAEEKAEKAKEEKKEEEEQLDEVKLKRARQEAMILGTKEAVEEARAQERKSKAPDVDLNDLAEIADSYRHTGDVQQSLEDLKYEMKLLDADLKGIQVDETL